MTVKARSLKENTNYMETERKEEAKRSQIKGELSNIENNVVFFSLILKTIGIDISD